MASAATRPRRNLGKESEPWGRSVDERLLKQQGAIDLLEQGNKNAFKGINASISGITRSLDAVAENQAELERQQEQLEAFTQTLPNHQFRVSYADMDGVSMSKTKVIEVEITIPTYHNYLWFLISNNGLFQAGGTTNVGLYVTTDMYADNNSLGGWSQFYGLYENHYVNVDNTYQWTAFANYGGKARVVISVHKDVDVAVPYRSLFSHVSVTSYQRNPVS